MKRIFLFLQYTLPFLLAMLILWWMFRGMDWAKICHSLIEDTHWAWMLISLLFGVFPLIFRALRWQLALAPLGEKASVRVCNNAIFLSYAASLLIPRVGEMTRCGTLKRYAKVSFSKSLGTVVAERIVDAVLMLLLAVVSFATQLPQFIAFLKNTGTSPGALLARFTLTGYWVTAFCLLLAGCFSYYLLRRAAFFRRGREKVKGFVEGIASLRKIEQLPKYVFYSLGIWLTYYLHFYLAFFAYESTVHISPLAGLLVFCVSSFAVLVPTPNGAGSWHFAVKTMLVLYGVAEESAVFFVLIVHSIQTLLVVLLGLIAWVDLLFMNRRNDTSFLSQKN